MKKATAQCLEETDHQHILPNLVAIKRLIKIENKQDLLRESSDNSF